MSNESRVAGWVDPELYPFPGRRVQVGGHDVHYVDTGHPSGSGDSAPTMLLLHGNPTWSFVYRGLIAALCGEVRCVAPDLPGFGLSVPAPGFKGSFAEHADAVQGFVEALDLREVVVVGQDWGGPIGLRLVGRQPERFAGVVLGNTWAWPVDGDPHFARFSTVMGGPLGALLIRRLNLFVNLMVPMGHRRRRLPRAEMAHYRRALAAPARRHLSAVLPRQIVAASAELAALADGLSGLRHLPVLIVWGDRDMAFRTKELERWREEVPGAKVEIVAGAGHFVQSDAPEEVASHLRAWLREHLDLEGRTRPAGGQR